MDKAFDELAALAGAVQLTPGNHPTPRFDQHAKRAPTRRHHGFDFTVRKRDVWTEDACCLVDADSVHPPRDGVAAVVSALGVAAWLEARTARDAPGPLLETMYPGYVLGRGEEIEEAMRVGSRLAVDVSHVFMQLASGVMTDATWRRLAEYEHIGEVHVSANDGTRDAHAPMTGGTFGLAWARERLQAGVPVVLECYMHRLSDAERRAQVDLVRGGS